MADWSHIVRAILLGGSDAFSEHEETVRIELGIDDSSGKAELAIETQQLFGCPEPTRCLSEHELRAIQDRTRRVVGSLARDRIREIAAALRVTGLRPLDSAKRLLTTAQQAGLLSVPKHTRKVKPQSLHTLHELEAFVAICGPLGCAAHWKITDRQLRAWRTKLAAGKRNIRLGVLLTSNLRYNQAIRVSFENRLQFHKDAGAWSQEIETVVGDNQLHVLLRRGRGEAAFDLLVGVGTQASRVIADWQRSEQAQGRGAPPLLFLGVTDPVHSQIVGSLVNRNESLQRGGVGYCGPHEDLPRTIANIFPGRRLRFVFSRRFPQDCALAERFAGHPTLGREVNLELYDIGDRVPSASDFAEKEIVYFSWYTLEDWFETAPDEALSLLDNVIFVATTRDNARANGTAVAAVSADDAEIGRLGADLVRAFLLEHRPLERADVFIPRYRFWLNEYALRSRGLSVSEQVRRDAEGVFGHPE